MKKNVLKSGERVVVPSVDGKQSRTDFKVLHHYPGATLLEARPVTGRNHQIRVHTQYAGHPIIGDSKYGNAAANMRFRQQTGIDRLFLHAMELSVPIDNSHRVMRFEAELDSELTEGLDKFARAAGG